MSHDHPCIVLGLSAGMMLACKIWLPDEVRNIMYVCVRLNFNQKASYSRLVKYKV